MAEPHYPQIILSFAYRGFKVEIDRDELDGQFIYAAWVNHDRGCAVAVPRAMTTIDAIRQAKQWIDKKLK
ncbi:conserved hypothetical protein [Hyella patelloides LEGE 07179]|uniref:Uncharacterized protein n=1 Tax=Hyella patelloides LEGE 07179 TaxID=945734 RepID=A0A563W0N3_9CYAN|nr:hypothetical protein [Hyella patelloides]VEP17236.1 conserved hypothetical protein [Hyella patelloides LEGE 07179]